MNDDHDDEGAARVFAALADPQSLRLLVHMLHVGQCDSTVGRRLDMTAPVTAAHLHRLVAAGLLTRSAPASSVYRVSDVAAVEHLLATVRGLALCERRA